MRFVDTSSLIVPLLWQTKAQKMLISIRGHPNRNKIINAHPIWNKLRSIFEKECSKKCWYTETKILGSSSHIDHFRPKCQVSSLDGTTREGYWWLAYDPTNYRLSCEFANCRRHGHDQVCGKGDYFPLVAGSYIARNEQDDINREQILLLDPTNRVDAELLSFDIDGKAISLCSEPEDELRVKTSIEIYHLNHSDFVEGRMTIITKCKELIEDLKYILEDLNISSTDRKINRLKNKISEIKATMDIKNAYSKCAMDFLKSQPNELKQYFNIPAY